MYVCALVYLLTFASIQWNSACVQTSSQWWYWCSPPNAWRGSRPSSSVGRLINHGHQLAATHQLCIWNKVLDKCFEGLVFHQPKRVKPVHHKSHNGFVYRPPWRGPGFVKSHLFRCMYGSLWYPLPLGQGQCCVVTQAAWMLSLKNMNIIFMTDSTAMELNRC